MEWKIQPPLISATIMVAVSHTTQRVLRAASGLPSSDMGVLPILKGGGVLHHGKPRSRVSNILYPCTLFMVNRAAMAHTIKEKKALLARVRRIQGQAAALERALEQESDCSAVLQQIASIRGAVNGLMAQVLEGHLREHLAAEERTAQERLEDLEQVVSVLRSYLK